MNRGRRWGVGCALLLLAGICAAAVMIWGGVWYIPREVRAEIGPASDALGPAQQILLAWQIYLKRDDLDRPVNGNGEERIFSVRMGETASSVAIRLENEGLVISGETFRLYLVYKGFDTTIQAGDYRLSPRANMIEIALELQDATPEDVEFNILPGWRAEEIAAALPTSGLEVAPQGFIQLVKAGRAGLAPGDLEIVSSYEGYLMPGSYRIPRQARADDLVKLFTAHFDEQVDDDLRAQFNARGLSLHEAVILASIVQREAVIEEEQPMISSVFFNRLAIGMSLESDPTVQYALGYNQQRRTWWTNPLSTGDLNVDSPYNTYRNAGLPPGPISNPGLSALRAVAYPAETPYYFFRAACDSSGRHLFARTYEEHLQNACP